MTIITLNYDALNTNVKMLLNSIVNNYRNKRPCLQQNTI